MSGTSTGTPEPLMGDAYWNLLERTARRVEAWPAWKRSKREANMLNKPNETNAVELAREWEAYLKDRALPRETEESDRIPDATFHTIEVLARAVIKQAKTIADCHIALGEDPHSDDETLASGIVPLKQRIAELERQLGE